EGQMFEIVHGLVRQGVVVGGGNVPGGDNQHPCCEADSWSKHHCERPPHRTKVRDPAQRRARKQEEEEWATQRDERDRPGSVADHQVLQHVRREEVAVPGLVERGHERQRPHSDRQREEQNPRQGRVLAASASAKPDEGVREERKHESGTAQDERRRIPCRPAHWKISVVQSPPCRRTSCARAGPSGRSSKSTKKSRSTSIPPF